MANVAALIACNSTRWTAAKITRGPEFEVVAKRLVAAKARYQAVATRTSVPWFIIAVIHEREASQNWNTQLGQGDPLHSVSTHIPKGRGPFSTWEAGAYDALVNCSPYAAKWKDWSPGGALTLLEKYNGLGYANRGLPSPYVWSGTDQYKSGKYVADGVFDAGAVDRQLGCAGLILAMQKLDPTISFGKTMPTVASKKTIAVATPVVAAAAAAKKAQESGASPVMIGAIIAIGVLVALAAFLYLHFRHKGTPNG